MRLALLADIHGNLPALEAVLADVERLGVDGIVVAGDLGFGPQTAEVTQRLRDIGARMIRGNNEDDVLRFGPGDPRWPTKQWAVMRWQSAHMDPATLAFTASLPGQEVIALPGTDTVRVVHGSPHHPAKPLFPDRDPVALHHLTMAGFLQSYPKVPPLAPAMAEVEERVLVCGHTHIPWQQREDGRLALNPGSVGAPLNGDPRAQYAFLTWRDGCWQADHRAVPYDLALLEAAFRESGLLMEGGAFARACLFWHRTGRAVPIWLLEHAYRLAEEAGLACDDAVPDEIWDRAVATFAWPDAEAGPPLSQ